MGVSWKIADVGFRGSSSVLSGCAPVPARRSKAAQLSVPWRVFNGPARAFSLCKAWIGKRRLAERVAAVASRRCAPCASAGSPWLGKGVRADELNGRESHQLVWRTAAWCGASLCPLWRKECLSFVRPRRPPNPTVLWWDRNL